MFQLRVWCMCVSLEGDLKVCPSIPEGSASVTSSPTLAWVGFWPRARSKSPKLADSMWPLPLRSNKEKASLNSIHQVEEMGGHGYQFGTMPKKKEKRTKRMMLFVGWKCFIPLI